jgi:hypothetical protein
MSHRVSKRPIWLADAAHPEAALPPKNDPSHRGIMTKTRGVVHMLVSGEAATGFFEPLVQKGVEFAIDPNENRILQLPIVS